MISLQTRTVLAVTLVGGHGSARGGVRPASFQLLADSVPAAFQVVKYGDS